MKMESASLSSSRLPQVNNSQDSIIQKINKVQENKTENEQAKFEEKLKEDKETKELSKKEVESIVNSLNEFMKPKLTSVHFKVHDETDRYYAQVVDSNTKEVIREIPPEKLLDLHAKMLEFVGLLVDKRI